VWLVGGRMLRAAQKWEQALISAAERRGYDDCSIIAMISRELRLSMRMLFLFSIWAGLLTAAFSLPRPYKLLLLPIPIGLIWIGWLMKNPAARQLGLALALYVLLATLLWQEKRVDDWNPQIESDADIVGAFSNGHATITLLADRTYTARNIDLPAMCQWHRETGPLTLYWGWGSGGQRSMKIVKAGGRFQIMTQPSDPDGWDGQLLPKLSGSAEP
jgi:hypothetical protein